MKKRMIAAALTAAMVMTMSMNVFAVSSTTGANSGNAGVAVEAAAPGAAVNTDTVRVAITRPDGTVAAVSLTEQVATARESVISLVATQTTSGSNAGLAVSKLMTTPATPMFRATINALGGNVGINDCGTVKTLAAAPDAFGNTIASAGLIPGVTAGSLVMLMSVNADGTVEFVEGLVDPVTGQVVGAFKVPLMHVCAYALHKGVIGAAGAVYHHGALDKHIYAYQRQQGDRKHKPSASQTKLPEREVDFGSNAGGLCRGRGTVECRIKKKHRCIFLLDWY